MGDDSIPLYPTLQAPTDSSRLVGEVLISAGSGLAPAEVDLYLADPSTVEFPLRGLIILEHSWTMGRWMPMIGFVILTLIFPR